MRQQTLGIVLLLALCLMSTAIAQEVSGSTSDNSTDNSTANTTVNETALANETDTNSTLSENDTDELSENETADNGTDIDSRDEHEVDTLNYPYGAEVRLMQLEKHVTRNLLIGTKVVEALNSTNSSANLTKLNAILDEMENLVQEIKGADMNQNKTQLAKDYVDFKKNATELTNEFRDEARPFINQTVRRDLKGTTDEIDKTVLKNLSDEINATRCEFNAKRLEAMLGALNVTNQALVDKVGSCQATDREIQSGIMDAFRNMSFQDRNLLKDKVQENRIRGNIAKRDVLREIKDSAIQKTADRQRMIQEKIANRTMSMNRTQFIESINERIAHIGDMPGRGNMPGNCTLCQDGTACNQTNSDNQTCTCIGNSTDGTYRLCGYGIAPGGNKTNGRPGTRQYHLKAIDEGLINGGPRR